MEMMSLDRWFFLSRMAWLNKIGLNRNKQIGVENYARNKKIFSFIKIFVFFSRKNNTESLQNVSDEGADTAA